MAFKLPFIYCATCRKCENRTFKNLFDDKALVDCADINGLGVKVIIPGILWKIDWCKIRYPKN